MSASERPQPVPTAQGISEAAVSEALPQESLLLEWRIHLLRNDPQKGWGVVAAFCMAALAGLVLFHSLLLSIAGALLIFSSASEFILPIRYRLTDRKAYCAFGATRYEIAWRDVRRLIPLADGVKLSPLSAASRLDAFRGVQLRFAGDGATGDREQVLRIVEERATRMESAAQVDCV